MGDSELFEHRCLYEGCIAVVQEDNKPFCEYHSPESVTEYVGYSARKEYNKKLQGENKTFKPLEDTVNELESKRKNIFDKEDNG